MVCFFSSGLRGQEGDCGRWWWFGGFFVCFFQGKTQKHLPQRFIFHFFIVLRKNSVSEIQLLGSLTLQITCVTYSSGYYRTERDKGTQYELFYKKMDGMEYRHVTLFRPFGPLMKVKSETVDISRSIINIIVPLAGRTEAFAQFMQNFRQVHEIIQ